MPRHRLRDAVWASLHAKLRAIPGIWKSDAERLRRFVEAVVFVLRTGVAWEDLPAHFGKPNSVCRRFRRWSRQGIWDELFLDGIPIDALETVMVDSTACKAQRHASGARGGGEEDLIGDRGYDTDGIRAWCTEHGIEAVIPSKRNRKVPIPHDRDAYRKRHRVENLFCRIKDFARIVLRKCKTSRSYAGFVSLAFALVNIQVCP